MPLHRDDPNWIGNKPKEELTEQDMRQVISDMVEDGDFELVGYDADGEPILKLKEA